MDSRFSHFKTALLLTALSGCGTSDVAWNRFSSSTVLTDYKSVILADVPLAYWRLNETSGATFKDETSNHYDGTLVFTGTPPTLGVTGALAGGVGAAVRFVANQGQGITANLTSINQASGSLVSVEFWMKWNGLYSAQGADPIAFTTSVSAGYAMWLHTSGGFGFNAWHSDVWGVPAAPFNGSWVHVVAEFFNATTGAQTSEQSLLYINGVLQTSSRQTGSAGGYGVVDPSFRIGGVTSISGYEFSGDLDEVSVFNYGLTQAQVTLHYKAGMGTL